VDIKAKSADKNIKFGKVDFDDIGVGST